MRDRAPASFSTRMERMCLMSELLGEDHLGQSLPAWNHRKDVLALIGDEVQEDQTLLLREGLLQGALHVCRLLDLDADVTVRLGKLHEVRQGVHIRLGVAVA